MIKMKNLQFTQKVWKISRLSISRQYIYIDVNKILGHYSLIESYNNMLINNKKTQNTSVSDLLCMFLLFNKKSIIVKKMSNFFYYNAFLRKLIQLLNYNVYLDVFINLFVLFFFAYSLNKRNATLFDVHTRNRFLYKSRVYYMVYDINYLLTLLSSIKLHLLKNLVRNKRNFILDNNANNEKGNIWIETKLKNSLKRKLIYKQKKIKQISISNFFLNKNKFKEINLFFYTNALEYKKRKKVVIKKKKDLEKKVSKFKKTNLKFKKINIKKQLTIKKTFSTNLVKKIKKNISDLLFNKYKYIKTLNSAFVFKRKIKSKRKSKNKRENKNKLKSLFLKNYRIKKKQVISNILKKKDNRISLKLKNKFNIYYTFFQIKKRISFLMNIQFNLYFINALSLSRYAFDKIHSNSISSLMVNASQRQKSLSKNYLNFLQKARLLEFKNSAIYVQDRVRISFCSLFYKKINYLVTFFAYSMSKLPRNIKETTYIRFFIKLIKALINKRAEIVGFRFRLQGRINRWRRTKYIIAEKGYINASVYYVKADYGLAQAINRKGAIGIRRTINYNKHFFNVLKNAYYGYMYKQQIFKINKKNIFNATATI